MFAKLISISVFYNIILVCCPIGLSSQGDFSSGLWLQESEPNWTSIKDEKLARVLNRVGPNLRSSANYFDYQDVELDETLTAWKLMRAKTLTWTQGQLLNMAPKLRQLMVESNVSSSCLRASETLVNAIGDLDFRPIQSK